MTEARPIKVIVVDDHPIVRSGLATMLLAFDDIELIGEAAGGEQALARCQACLPDVILMDMVMPGMDGPAATRAVLNRYPQVKIIVLTSFAEENQVQDALEAGAIGYLLKNVAIDTLADAIRSAYAGLPALGPEAAQTLIQARKPTQRLGDDLSTREREVLALVVRGLSNIEIAKRLSISPATARHHVSACISKLDAANRAQAAAIAVEYRLIP